MWYVLDLETRMIVGIRDNEERAKADREDYIKSIVKYSEDDAERKIVEAQIIVVEGSK